MADYVIRDEPRSSAIEGFTVHPVLPLFATMFAGGLVASAWFAVNALAMGTWDRWRNVAVAGFGYLAYQIALWGWFVLVVQEAVPGEATPYAIIGILLIRLMVGYILYLWQMPSYQLHTYFGRKTGQGLLILLALIAFRQLVTLPPPLNLVFL